jgi:quinol monooxygenase YgiN
MRETVDCAVSLICVHNTRGVEMKPSLEKIRICASYSQIEVRFKAGSERPCGEITGVIKQLASLPGCLDYSLSYKKANALDWSIESAWASPAARESHYKSEHIQVLFHHLLRKNPYLIRCRECYTPPEQLSASARVHIDPPITTPDIRVDVGSHLPAADFETMHHTIKG